MLPSIFGENLFDEFFGNPFGLVNTAPAEEALSGTHARNLMSTDVRATEDSYELAVDLPGFQKDEAPLAQKDACLTIGASKGLDRDEKDEAGKYIRRERYAGVCSRSFYVGTAVRPEDISARYEDGILKLSVPKTVKKELPASTSIAIE